MAAEYNPIQCGWFGNRRAFVNGNPELADVLHIGDAIAVIGKICELDSMILTFDEAEVVSR